MSDIQLLEDLAAEFDRVAIAMPARRRRVSRRPRAALALVTVALLGGTAYAVPVTRAAIDDVTGTFAGWVGGGDDAPPGRALRPDDDAPAWVRAEGASSRQIAYAGGVGLYVTRRRLQGEVYLDFSLGHAVGIGDTVAGWRDRFDDHAVVILGPTPLGPQRQWDEQGRFALMGVTAASVTRVELRYASGRPTVADGLQGGFVLLADSARALREIVAYRADGREVDRTDASYIDWRR